MIQHHWSGHLTQKIHDNPRTKLSWLDISVYQIVGITSSSFTYFTAYKFNLVQFTCESETPTVEQNDTSVFAQGPQVYMGCKVPMGGSLHPVSHDDVCDLEESYQGKA